MTDEKPQRTGQLATRRPEPHDFLFRLGPGLITGAADDDPSGIATYSQAGATFGFGLLWTMILTFPLMAAIQEICGRFGRITGTGIAESLRKCSRGRWSMASSFCSASPILSIWAPM
jgi:Mn2+/Fe2+ NRAMP family transporter